MTSIADVRAQFPMYSDVNDDSLLRAVHGRFYQDMPYEAFRGRIQSDPPAPQPVRQYGVLAPAARGVDELQGAGFSAIEGTGRMTGIETLERIGREGRIRNRDEAEESFPQSQLQSFGDANSLGSFARATGQAISRSLPETAAVLAAAGAGALAGSAVPGLGTLAGAAIGGTAAAVPLFYGRNRERQMDANNGEVQSEGAALGAAVPQALADTALGLLTLRMGRVLGAPAEEVGRSLFPRIARGIGFGAATEVPTEVFQQAVERAQAGLDIFSPEAMGEYREAAIGAAAVGGTLGGTATGVFGRRPGPSEQERERAARAAEDARLLDAARAYNEGREVSEQTLLLDSPDARRFTAEALRGEQVPTDENERALSRRDRDLMADLPIGTNRDGSDETIDQFDRRLQQRFPELSSLEDMRERVRLGTQLLQQEREEQSRLREVAEQFADLEKRTGVDTLTMVQQTLPNLVPRGVRDGADGGAVAQSGPITRDEFSRLSANARLQLVERAMTTRQAAEPGAPLYTSFNMSAAEGGTSPASRPNAPADTTTARGNFEDTTRAASPLASEIDRQKAPSARDIQQANEAQAQSDAIGVRLDRLRAQREDLMRDQTFADLRRRASVGPITPMEAQRLNGFQRKLEGLDTRIQSDRTRADALSRRAGFGSQSASGTSDRPFGGFESGREEAAVPGDGMPQAGFDYTDPDTGETSFAGFERQPGAVPETQARYLARVAQEKAKAEYDAAWQRILDEWGARTKQREEAQRDQADADAANQRYSESVNDPGKATADGFWNADDGGFLNSGKKIVEFPTKKSAAQWMARNGQGGYWDMVVSRANSDAVYLRARPTYAQARAEAAARSKGGQQSSEPAGSLGRQYSAAQAGLAEPTTTTAPAADETAAEAAPDKQAARQAADRILREKLTEIRKRGRQGALAANAAFSAIKSGQFTPEQMVAAIRLAEQFAKTSPNSAVRISFDQELKQPNKDGKLVEVQAFIDTIKNGPNGVEAVAKFSLSPNALNLKDLTGRHEAFHLLQALFKGSDPKIDGVLARAFPEGKGLDAIDPTILRNLKTTRRAGGNQSYFNWLQSALKDETRSSEVQAYVFSALVDAKVKGENIGGIKPSLLRFVNYLAQMKQRVGAALRGDGITARGVMERAERGEFGELTRAQETTGAQASAINPDAARQFSATGAPIGSRVTPSTASDIAGARFNVEYARTTKLIQRALEKTPGIKRLVNPKSAEDLIIKMQDTMIPVGRMVDDVREKGGTVAEAADTYLADDNYSGRVGDQLRQSAAKLYKPAFDTMKRLNISQQEMSDYLYLRHAKERDTYIASINGDTTKGSGLTPERRADIEKSIAGKKAELAQAAVLWDAIIANTRDTRVEFGLTPDFEKMPGVAKYKHYVPLRGFADESVFEDGGVEAIRARVGQGFNIKGREDRRALGRSSEAGDILANIILQNEESIIRGEKNRVGQSFLKLVRDNEAMLGDSVKILTTSPVKPTMVNGAVKLMPDPLYKNRDDVLVVKEGGKEIAIEIKDERVAKAMKGSTGLGSENLGSILRAMGLFNRYLTTINTAWNPEFLIANFVRDLQTAGINIQQYGVGGLTKEIAGNVPAALRGIRAVLRDGKRDPVWSDTYDAFRKAGGSTEFLGLRDMESQLDRINKELTGDPGRGKKAFQALAKFVEDYNQVVESGVRLSTFHALRQRGVSDAKAAQVAKNLTVNFNRGGENKAFMNSMYLFYNASLQGTMAMVNAITRSPRVRKIVAGVVVAGLLQDAINSMMSGEDDDGEKVYDKIPRYVLEHNLIMMDPFGITQRGYFSFPMPYGFNAFHNLGRVMGRTSRGAYTPMEAMSSGVVAFVDAFNPVGGTEDFLNFVAPTILDPLVSIGLNQDFAGRAIVPNDRGFGPPKPDSQKYWSTTNPLAIGVADWLNTLTGGTPVIPGAVDISPNTIGFLANYAVGAAGAFVGRTYQTATQTIPQSLTGELAELDIRTVPFARKVFGNVTERNNLEQYFERTNTVLRARQEFDDANRFGQPERAERVMRDYPRELAISDAMKDLTRARGQISSEINLLRNFRGEGLSDQERRDRIKLLQQRQNELVSTANRIYRENVRP